MRTSQLFLAAALATAALSANAGPPTESGPGPFTYEALGATPVVTFGRASAATKAAEAPKPAAPARATATAPKGAATATSTFTYDALGATPHVEATKRQPATSEAQAPATAH